jgi:hypothetical protein
VALRAHQHQVHPDTSISIQGGWHMQANDAELTELYTAAVGEEVENNEPNANNTAAGAATFDLRLQAVAGSVLGDSRAEYKLRIDCIDETLAAPNPIMSVPEVTQQFDPNSPNDWLEQVTSGNFVKEQKNTINVDAAAKGHVLRYVASLRGVNGDVVSFIESNKFVLI